MQILIGLVTGVVLGLLANYLGAIPKAADGSAQTVAADKNANGLHDAVDTLVNIADPLGKIFLRLMFMVVVPLVFSALALAVVEIGDVRKLGRVGLVTLFYTGIFSLTAVFIGIGLVNLIKPGDSLSPEQREKLQTKYAKGADEKVGKAKQAKSITDTLVDLIPENPVQEIVGAVDGSSKGNGMLAVMFFALTVGIAITMVPEKCQTLVGWMEGWFAVAMIVIRFAMHLAPYGAGCLVFSLTAQLGVDILVTLGWFVVTAMLGMAIHQIVVYSVAIRLFGGMSPLAFFRHISEAMMVAFGTSSSNASLPTALKVARENLKLPPKIANFVLTVGATGNQNGTALYEGVVVLFLAQVFGIELSLGQQVQVVLMSVLSGIGTAGVPGGSLPLIVVLLESVGIPGAGIGIILGVDRLLDMCRTVLNVSGDLAVATCVSRTEQGAEG